MESKWKKNLGLFLCPLCGKKMDIYKTSYICVSNHCYDISRKGYLNFVQKRMDKVYSTELFENRTALYEYGFYNRVFDEINSLICDEIAEMKDTVIVDAGCGEGTLLTKVCNRNECNKIGLDISKEAIICACKKTKEIIWLVADLANIPLKGNSVDIVCNFLSPANYNSFNKILKPTGTLIKIVAGQKYLKELRHLAFLQHERQEKDEQQILDYMQQNMNIVKKVRMLYEVKVNKTQLDSWMKMTPMLVNAKINEALLSDINRVTIDLIICVCKRK